MLREALLFIHCRESLTLPEQILLIFLSNDYLREGVSSVGSRSSEGGEESSSSSGFNCIDHSLLRLMQMRSLPEGADEHKYIVHP